MRAPMMQPPIILLKDGTDTSQGKPQIVSNIGACLAVADVVRTTLGPLGMDKLIYDEQGKVTISNDGATIMRLLEVIHPAARTLVDISLSQDSQVGDGTTTVVLLAAELLKQAKQFIEEGVHPRVIVRTYRKACAMAIERLKQLTVKVGGGSEAELRNVLLKCAATSLQSKLVSGQKEFFSGLVVDAVCALDEQRDMKMIGIKKVQGGGLLDSLLVKGVAFKKTFSYAGFEQQPKKFKNPRIIILNIELELKAERSNAEIRLNNPEDYQSIVDAEWNIIYHKLKQCVDAGAQIVLSRLPIGDLATQYFADRNIFCAGRVEESDIARVCKATGARVLSSVNDVDAAALGTCGLFEEKQIGAERYNLFTECQKAQTATLILRGGSEQFIDEAERSLHDAIMIVRRALKSSDVVAGGGAVDMELSKYLRKAARDIAGKEQLFVNAFAKSLEVIPQQLADNAGFDATEVLNQLRQKHASGEDQANWGIDISTGEVADTYKLYVWEPALVKLNALSSATEAAVLVLSVDETVRNPASQPDPSQQQPVPPPGGRGMGRAMRGRGGSRR